MPTLPALDGFATALAAGDAEVVEHHARAVLADGLPLLALYERLTDVLEEIGQCWARGDISVADEHRATAVARWLVARLRGAPPHAVRGSVVLATLGEERHTLGLEVLQHLFELARYRAIPLFDLPDDDLVAATTQVPALRAVLVSAHVPLDRPRLRAFVRAVRNVMPDTTVVVGGPAFATPAPDRCGAHAVRLTARDALATVDAVATPLSRREAEVLELLADGLTNNQIAAALDLSSSTVKDHVDAVIAKLGAQSRTGAVAYAFRAGLLR